MAKKRLSSRKKNERDIIAGERVEILLELAKKAYRHGLQERAQRYCKLARKIQLRYRVRLKKESGLKYCKKCCMPWVQGENLRVRMLSRKRCIEYSCKCGYKRVIGY